MPSNYWLQINGLQRNLCPCHTTYHFLLSHLSGQKTWLEHWSFGCVHWLSPSWHWWRWYQYDPAWRLAGRPQRISNHCSDNESTLRPQTRSTTLAWWYSQCLALSGVCTVPGRHQPLSLPWCYSDTFVQQQRLKVVSGICFPSCDWCEGQALRHIQDHKSQSGTPIPRHWNLQWENWNWHRHWSWPEGLYHNNSQTIEYAKCSQCINSNESKFVKLDLANNQGEKELKAIKGY